MDVVSEILVIQNKIKCRFQPKTSLHLSDCICKRVRKEPWLTELSSLAKKGVCLLFFFFQFNTVS